MVIFTLPPSLWQSVNIFKAIIINLFIKIEIKIKNDEKNIKTYKKEEEKNFYKYFYI